MYVHKYKSTTLSEDPKGTTCVCKDCYKKGECGYVYIDECRWVRIGGEKP